jgi:membrane-associated protease RseP (regulator of RpoE activity)
MEKTTAGYKRSLEAALAVHTAYPVNKAALADKQGVLTPFATPIEIPLLAGKYKRDLDWEGKVVGSCVHCHQIGDAYRSFYRDQGKPVPSELIYPMPMPETVGITLEADQLAKVKAVAADSIAARAGVQAGDEFQLLGGQLLMSIADFSWALNRAPEAGALPARVKRGATELALTLALPDGWRAKSDISRRVGTWPMRGMASGGMVLVDLSDEERAKRGLANDQLGLFVKFLGQFGKHAAAKNAGFMKDDVLVELNGQTARITEGELIGRLLRETKPGDKLKAVVLRGDQRVELLLPMQ